MGILPGKKKRSRGSARAVDQTDTELCHQIPSNSVVYQSCEQRRVRKREREREREKARQWLAWK